MSRSRQLRLQAGSCQSARRATRAQVPCVADARPGGSSRHTRIQRDARCCRRSSIPNPDGVRQQCSRRCRNRRHALNDREIGLAGVEQPVHDCPADRLSIAEPSAGTAPRRRARAYSHPPVYRSRESVVRWLGRRERDAEDREAGGIPGWLIVSWIASGANPMNDTLSNCVSVPPFTVSGTP